MNARFVYTKIWTDDWFSSLSQPSKMLFLYILTNANAGLSGIYELSDRKILFETGMQKDELDQGKEDLKQKISFYKGWVRIINSVKYNRSYTENIKNKTALVKELSYINKEILTYFDGLSKFDDSLSSLRDGLCPKTDGTNTNTNINTNTNTNTNTARIEEIKKNLHNKFKSLK